MSDVGQAGLVSASERHCAALGITAACDADTRRDSLTAYAAADERGTLDVQIAGLVVHDEVDWLLASGLRGRRSGRLAAGAVKIWADGGMSSRTAAIHGHYPVPPYGSGIMNFQPGELAAMVSGIRRPRAPGVHPRPGGPGHRGRPRRLRSRGGRPGGATRCGTASSTPARCTRRSRRGRRPWASWSRPSPGSCPASATASPRPSPAAPTSCTRSRPGGGPGSPWPGPRTRR